VIRVVETGDPELLPEEDEDEEDDDEDITVFVFVSLDSCFVSKDDDFVDPVSNKTIR